MNCQSCGKALMDGKEECDSCPHNPLDNSMAGANISGTASVQNQQSGEATGVGIREANFHGPVHFHSVPPAQQTDKPKPHQRRLVSAASATAVLVLAYYLLPVPYLNSLDAAIWPSLGTNFIYVVDVFLFGVYSLVIGILLSMFLKKLYTEVGSSPPNWGRILAGSVLLLGVSAIVVWQVQRMNSPPLLQWFWCAVWVVTTALVGLRHQLRLSDVETGHSIKYHLFALICFPFLIVGYASSLYLWLPATLGGHHKENVRFVWKQQLSPLLRNGQDGYTETVSLLYQDWSGYWVQHLDTSLDKYQVLHVNGTLVDVPIRSSRPPASAYVRQKRWKIEQQ